MLSFVTYDASCSKGRLSSVAHAKSASVGTWAIVRINTHWITEGEGNSSIAFSWTKPAERGVCRDERMDHNFLLISFHHFPALSWRLSLPPRVVDCWKWNYLQDCYLGRSLSNRSLSLPNKTPFIRESFQFHRFRQGSPVPDRIRSTILFTSVY